MNRFFLYIFFVLCVGTQSCITYIDRELEVTPKLVLNCYLVPQLDTTILQLTNSASLFSRKPQKIQAVLNATVEISNDNTHWVLMSFDPDHQFYFITQADFPILEGKTYHVRASAANFETVTASCTVPVLRETNISVVEECTETEYGYTHCELLVKWNDFPQEDNYYMLSNKNLYHDYWYSYNSYDTIQYFNWYFLYDNDNNKPCIYSDKDQDGKKMSVSTSYYLYENNEFCELALLQTDINCYQFQLCLSNYDADFQFFMLEPVQIYSNIQNGYGIFGAFVMERIELAGMR
ncbi:MAG: DUF4249 domain-containing protein [Lentimicrobiaceae bacterium]|nr:DUF4249 domain-containing protein [Lentimicrobiaceae bacterium]